MEEGLTLVCPAVSLLTWTTEGKIYAVCARTTLHTADVNHENITDWKTLPSHAASHGDDHLTPISGKRSETLPDMFLRKFRIS